MNIQIENKKESRKKLTSFIITGVICFLLGLIVGVFIQQAMSRQFLNNCSIPIKLDSNITSGNTQE